MGAQTLESSLRWRLFALLAPALVAVGIASVAVTRRALDAADDATARAGAEDLLRELRRELAEGDAPDAALREVLAEADADGLRAVLFTTQPAGAWKTQRQLPGDLAALRDGGCATARDEGGAPWHACETTESGATAVVAIPVSAHASVVRTVSASMLAIVALALVAMVAAAKLAVRRPLASLRRLVAWSERVAAADAPLPPPRADTVEIERLTVASEALVQRLLDALGRERATSAHIAHELRTPLTAMRAELEAMAPGEGDPARRMLADVDRLARVIDAILVLSESRTPSRAIGVVNVADVVRELAPRATEVFAPDEALVDADPRLVELALRNLLENAEKYSGHPALAARVSREEAGTKVAVVDDGPGLDAEARAKMFDRYWRGTSDSAGSGLGLALVRAVAERYGGHAEARPNPGGRGLEVSITFGHVLGWHEGDSENDKGR